jgi:hypothetical protein
MHTCESIISNTGKSSIGVEIARAMVEARWRIGAGSQMSFRGFNTRALFFARAPERGRRPRGSTLLIRNVACALLALAGRARAEPPALVAASESDTNAPVEALPSLEQGLDPSAYHRVKALAVEEWNAGRWTEARALFLLAHGLRPSARTLRALGKTAFELRLYPEAVRELGAALTDQRQPLDATMRNEARALLQRAEAFVGRYHIQLVPADAALRVDGGTPMLEQDGSVLLALGHHQLEIEASGYRSERHEIMVADSSGQKLVFRLSPVVKPLPPAPLSPHHDESELRYHAWSLSTAGGAVVLGTTSLALFLRANKEDERFESTCDGWCSRDAGLSDKRDALVIASYATLGAASVCAAASAVLFFVERQRLKNDRRQAGASGRRAQLRLGLGAVGLQF